MMMKYFVQNSTKGSGYKLSKREYLHQVVLQCRWCCL